MGRSKRREESGNEVGEYRFGADFHADCDGGSERAIVRNSPQET